MPPLWIIPVVCAVVALICMGAGAIALLRAQRTLRTHAELLQAAGSSVLFDSGRLEAALSRMGSDAEALQAELARAGAALRVIADAARDVRLREALTALRVAAISLRALRSLF